MSSPLKPILVVDKKGVIGKSLVDRLTNLSLVIFVSKEDCTKKNVVGIPFEKKIPKIPNNAFSTIIIVYSGESELEQSMPAFISKAKETNARLVLVTSIFYFKDSIVSGLFSRYEHSQVVVLGDFFPGSTPTPVNLLLQEIKSEGKLELINNGLDLLYPISLSQAIEGIESAIFSLPQDKQVYAVLPPYPLTELSFARILQKDQPLLHIDFIKGNHKHPSTTLPQAAVPVLEDYHLEKELKKLNLTMPLPKKAVLIKTTKRPSRTRNSISRPKRSLFLLVSLAFFVLALPFIITLSTAIFGGLLLRQAVDQAERGELGYAYQNAKSASTFLSLSDQTATTLGTVLSLMGLANQARPVQKLIHSGKDISVASSEFLESGIQLQQALTTKGASSKSEFQSAIGNLKQAALSLQEIQAEDQLPETYKKSLSRFDKPLGLLINLLDVSPKLLGFDGEQKYLILFQNNFELRPGGGFIGSYGLLTLDHGKVKNLTIHDVYDADGKLKASIDPPFGLRRYMGASHWFLRDSNFHPDFITSAAEAASFLKLETGERVNGVIGIDVSFLSSLLETTGPISVPDYKQTLTKDNFYLLAQSQAEDNFFPGSTQKKDFLKAAEIELMKRVEQRSFSYQKMVNLVMQAISQKHLLVSVPDPAIQKLFTINGLSGTIEDHRLTTPTTFVDSVGVSEANIGQNKSNYYVKRAIQQDVVIDGEGVVSGTITLTFTNTSSKRTKFGGDYKSYLRLLVPEGARLTNVLMDKESQLIAEAITDPRIYQARSFHPPLGVEIDQTIENEKTMYGLVVTVPQQTTKVVGLSYELSSKVDVSQDKWTYSHLMIKQPGTLNDPYQLTVNYPLAVRLLKATAGVNDLGGKAVFETTLSSDQETNFTFISK